MATIDEQFVDYIVKQLVNKPEAVQIERVVDEMGVLLKLTVDPEDIGRVIGKRGATAQSLRNLLRALGSKNDARYNLKIIDVDKPGNEEAPAAQPAETASETPETSEMPVENEQPVEDSTSEDVENESDLAQKTRKDLAELDDLDI